MDVVAAAKREFAGCEELLGPMFEDIEADAGG
jgi:hypothetical protein